MSSSDEEWDVVHPDWWRTSFEDVAWAPSTSASRRPNTAEWTAPGYIARPLPYTRIRSRDTSSEDLERINPALHGCQGAEDVLTSYEHSTGFHASFWDLEEDKEITPWEVLMNDLNPTLTRDSDLCHRNLTPHENKSFDPFEVNSKPLNAQAAPFVSSPAMRLQKDAQGFYSGVEETPKRRSKTRSIIESMPRKGYASVLKHGWSQDDLSEEDGWIGERTRTSKNLFKTLSRHRSESTASTSSTLDDDDAATYELTLPLQSPSPSLSSNDGWIEGLPTVPRKRPPPLHRKGASASSVSSSSSFSSSSAPHSAISPMFQTPPFGFWPVYTTTPYNC